MTADALSFIFLSTIFLSKRQPLKFLIRVIRVIRGFLRLRLRPKAALGLIPGSSTDFCESTWPAHKLVPRITNSVFHPWYCHAIRGLHFAICVKIRELGKRMGRHFVIPVRVRHVASRCSVRAARHFTGIRHAPVGAGTGRQGRSRRTCRAASLRAARRPGRHP